MQGLRLIGVTCHAELASGAVRDLHDFATATAPLARTPEQGLAPYAEAAKRLGRLLAPLADLVIAVGQAHLLRQRVATQLHNISRCDVTAQVANLSQCKRLGTSVVGPIHRHQLPHPGCNRQVSEMRDCPVG